MEHPVWRVGRLVVAKVATGVCDKGEVGVVYEVYDRIAPGERWGVSVIFEKGRYDGFSAREVALMLTPLAMQADYLADYMFENVTRLSKHYRTLHFKAAFILARMAVQPAP